MFAAGKRVAEAGTAFGEGAAAMAATAHRVVTAEHDVERAAVAAERLAAFPNVELVVGPWQDALPPRAPSTSSSTTRETSSATPNATPGSWSTSSLRAACSSSTT